MSCHLLTSPLHGKWQWQIEVWSFVVAAGDVMSVCYLYPFCESEREKNAPCVHLAHFLFPPCESGVTEKLQ